MLTFILFLSHSYAATQLDLRATIQHALEHSPSLRSVTQDLQIRQLEKKSAIAAFLPKLDLEATHGLQEDFKSTRAGEPWTSQLSLGLTETLYDNGETITRLRMSGLREEQGELAFRRERDKLCRDVALEFFRYSLAQKILEIQKTQTELLKKQFKLISSEYHQGLKMRKDYLRFKTQINRVEIDLTRAQNDVTKITHELNRLLAWEADPTPTYLPDEGVPQAVPSNMPDLQKHYDYRVFALQKEINSLESSLIGRKVWPELYLTSALTYQSSDYINTGNSFGDQGHVGWNALFTLRFNLWDWGTRRRTGEIASLKSEIQSNLMENDLLAVRAELEKLMIDLKQSKAHYDLTQELITLERGNFALLESEYRRGKVSYLDLITGLRDQADAKIKFYNAFYELKKGLFTYRYHEGTAYDSLTRK